MNDYTPQVSREDLLRIIARDFPPEDHTAILELLDTYGSESWHREHHRVRAAVLKLADGDTAQVEICVQGASKDYRDVLAWAEYPNGMKLGHQGPGPEHAEQNRQARNTDWDQYEEWFHQS